MKGQGRHRNPPARGHLVLPSLVAVAVLSIGGISAGAALGGGDSHSTPSSPVRPAGTTSTMPTTSAAPTAPAPTGASLVSPAPSSRILPDFAVIVTGRSCWVQVLGPHHHVLYAGIVRRGHAVAYRQRPLQVTLGDAGAARIVLHHRDRGRAGRAGQVVNFTVR